MARLFNPEKIFKSKLRIIIISGILIELFFLSFVFLNGNSGSIPLYMFVYFETFIVLSFAFFALKKFESLPVSSVNNINKILKLFQKVIGLQEVDCSKLKIPLAVVIFGLMFRLTLIPATPTTSQDVYRYIWEGKILTEGYNPFVYPPESDTLKPFRSDVYEKVTYKHIPTIYPPFAQIVFAGAYLLSGESLLGLKIIYFISEILLMFFLLKLLHLKKVNLNYILLYAWLPLPIMETFVNAHIDIIGAAFLIIFIYLIETDKFYRASIAFSLSFLSKLFPLFLFPLLIKKIGLKRTIIFGFFFVLITAVFYYPFISKNLGVITALQKYLNNWEFNGSVYKIAKLLTDSYTARRICAGLFAVLIIWVSYKYKDFTGAVLTVFLGLIIFSTTLYPWYLQWAASLNPVLNFYSLYSLFFTVNFTNFSPLGPVWKEYAFVVFVQYFPFYVLLYYDFKKAGEKKVL